MWLEDFAHFNCSDEMYFPNLKMFYDGTGDGCDTDVSRFLLGCAFVHVQKSYWSGHIHT